MTAPSTKQILTGLALATWATLVCAAVMPFFAGHFLVFDSSGPTTVAAAPGAWSMTHVLGQRCFCSQTVVPYLLKRGPVDAREKVLFFGTDFPRADELRARGFEVELRDPQRLDTDGVTAVPFLVIADPAGQVVYTGGYSDHRVTADTPMKDVATLAQLRSGNPSNALPVIGCAVSAKYQALLDPLGVKTMGAVR